jgi:sugar/nucleoside kinase (ribokinase family)
VDILLANEAEIVSLYEVEDSDRAVGMLADDCGTAAVTFGESGSVVLADGKRFEVAAEPAERVIDTTGAGDLYASGFLLGLTRGMEPARCGRLASFAAAEVISHFGARPEVSLAERATDLLRP